MQKIIKICSILGCIFSITTSLFFTGCSSSENNKVVEKAKYVVPDSLIKTLLIYTVTKSQLSKTVTLTGKVAFNDDNVVKIYPMVSGNVQGINV
ncbi:MAG: efflux RND transporter periplasmic adaptor subunit, partial [Pedobacter sp.]|nr:efflux RND transporter periplasmic adaptor subunit [Chitinophagaceae bacterium]